MNETFFQNRIPSAEKLLAFGFSQEEGGYAYGTPVCGGAVEILDLRAAAEKLPSVIDGKRFFAGYHMNKNIGSRRCPTARYRRKSCTVSSTKAICRRRKNKGGNYV